LISKEYNGIFEKLQIKCACGNDFNVSFDNFKNNNVTRCFKCFINTVNKDKALSYDKVKNFIEIESKSGCELISKEYKNAIENLQIRCSCGEVFNVNFNKFKSDHQRQCKKCILKISKGEILISNILFDNNIYYQNEYKFINCKNINPLPFDFAVFVDKEKTGLKLLIEYDGEQHYRPVKFNGMSLEKAEANFIKTQKHDGIKNNYCASNNIPLLRIPYWEKNNIKDIIDNFLLELNTQEAV